ncbi:Na+/H+ antiporter subunit E [Cellulomonas bogoriensis]|uniref:Cation transporter n=1 Tax=Cellulomonas bogoriensis 69B4 = DSM 16987 TaxID=1386082 RepID=A0A0A0C0Y8_9CELL|nr:Na+/H+ antiporter subunit E [Cellulomonas bogoriensis]KGM13876.1 cation transporter [Cellulomonas bogoriensis 69B4 = DSM 16987]
MTALLRWTGRILAFPFSFAYEVVKANLVLAGDILTPGSRINAGFVELPLRCRTDMEITTIANFITLTPGTVTVAVRKDPATLWVHGMYIDDVEEFRAELYAMEATVIGVLRKDPDPGPVPLAPRTEEQS